MRRIKTFMGLCLLLMPISLIMWVWIPGLWKVTLSLVMFWGFGALLIAEEEPEEDPAKDPDDLLDELFHGSIWDKLEPLKQEGIKFDGNKFYDCVLNGNDPISLREKLKQAIECEDFETAAIIRDKIKERK